VKHNQSARLLKCCSCMTDRWRRGTVFLPLLVFGRSVCLFADSVCGRAV
jgi:hypothetical protein